MSAVNSKAKPNNGEKELKDKAIAIFGLERVVSVANQLVNVADAGYGDGTKNIRLRVSSDVTGKDIERIPKDLLLFSISRVGADEKEGPVDVTLQTKTD